MAVQLTLEEATVIAKKAVEISCAELAAEGVTAPNFDAYSAAQQAAAAAGIARAVEAMQHLGFKVERLTRAPAGTK